MEHAPFADLLAYPLRSGFTVPAGSRGEGIRMINMGELFRFPRMPSIEMARVDILNDDPERTLVQPGDLLFARRSLTLEGAGKCSIVKVVTEPTTWESSILRARLDNAKACPDYYFYYFSSPQGRFRMSTIVEQVAAAGIRSSDLARLSVPVPPLKDQQAIAEVLGALDDKIALNLAIATSTDQLLAAEFEAAVMGAPSVKVGEIATVNEQSVKPQSGKTLRYIDISSVGVGTYDYPEATDWDDAPSRARRQVLSGDTLWATVRPNRRSHALVLENDSSLVASTGLAVLRPKKVGAAYLYEATSTPAFTSYLENVAEGSAYPAVKAAHFSAAPIPWPHAATRSRFESLAEPIRAAVHNLNIESRKLAEIRNTLLPQLMSGKLKVKDAEKVVEGAV